MYMCGNVLIMLIAIEERSDVLCRPIYLPWSCHRYIHDEYLCYSLSPKLTWIYTHDLNIDMTPQKRNLKIPVLHY